MTYTSQKPVDQRFIHSGITWSQFKSIQAGFLDSPGIQLFYYRGELEILSTSPDHEIVKGNLGYLLETYLVEREIDFMGTGSCSLEKENEASVMANESYCFGEQKPIPDLAIEVVLTSGGTPKLERYKALGVKEVWFWENRKISVYALENERYQSIARSQFVPNLNLEWLARCATLSSRIQAVREFRTRSTL
ncbi:MAG: Uma2 family endonuclease [Cyanobacteriota bacterium]|nr:Uma2 family endonuclease [Cyanobacteriota bacterium]